MSAIFYTIGYATKPIDTFIAQLKEFNINVVVDVRSVPYSKVFHDYHRESIAARLQQESIAYTFIGDELGPRSKDPEHYDGSGQVQFDRLMQAPLFLEGIQRLKNGIDKGYTMALMCAEKDPATCHRSLLVGYFLAKHTLGKVQHINHDGELETQQALEQRLCELNGMAGDLFASADEQQQQAYELQLKKTSYRKPEM